MQTFLEFIKVRSSIFMEATPPPAVNALLTVMVHPALLEWWWCSQ